jgi:hypothetical protein
MSLDSQLALKSVATITAEKLKFFIPDYQRGYRWEEEQVKYLLKDLLDFFQSGKPLYCLQPLVVVKRENEWEVVDGQQRLTTLFLVLSHLLGEHPGFEIRYQRHEKHFAELSPTLWEILSRNDSDDDRKIPDLYFMRDAERVIEDFSKNQKERLQQLKELSAPAVSFIWYELPKSVSNEEGNSIAAFTRLNAGKIALTDVELIRALFLRSDSELTESERLRIATVWDQMEKRLNEYEFWSFAAPTDYNPVNRIELVFQMVAGKRLKQQDHELFHHVEKNIRNRSARETWAELESAYSALEEWHDDHALFHLIGYLSNDGGNKKSAVWDLYHAYWLSKQVTTKDTFLKALKGIIKERLVGSRTIQEVLDVLDYRNRNSDIKSPLLCFNLASLLSDQHGTVRFSFYAFRTQEWHVEHIHAIATEELIGRDLDGILEMYQNYFKRQKSKETEEFAKELAAILDPQTKADPSAKQALYQECLRLESADHDNGEKPDEDALNTLGNLTLLDSKTNCGFKNASFRVKRAWILDPDRQNIYVPPGTRSVFTKSYTAEAKELFRWDLRPGKDGSSYLQAMVETLESFFEGAEQLEPGKPPIAEEHVGSSATKQHATVSTDDEQNKSDHTQNSEPPQFPPGETLSFLELLATYDRIEIPLIQRDYAQGRDSELTIRSAFLDSIFGALKKGETLNLDFVYGIAGEDKIFNPIDGQQRLTTLFLLHWFAFRRMGKLEDFRKDLSRFHYRVRPGAERFFPALLERGATSDILAGGKWFQMELPKQIWFSKSWLNDPTVRGALVMLDAIKARFESFSQDGLEARLRNIKMEVLVLPESISADEVYLKMNARGKALTDFEKFKAWLIKQYSSLEAKCGWKLRLDQDWLEFFWGKSEDKKDRATTVSACFFNTVLALAINAQAGRESRSGESGEKEKAKAFNDQISNWIHLDRAYRVNEWEKLFDTTTVDWVFNSLDEFYNRMGEIESLMKSGDWISPNKLVIFDPDPKLSPKDRCWLHAITLYCQDKCGDDREWVRVARNLISNTDIADIPDTIRSLNKLAEGMNSGVLQRLVSMEDGEAVGFMPKSFREQLEEERTKARLLSDANAEWEVIRTVEKHPFLKGQIGVLLRDSANEKLIVDSGTFSKRWKTFKLLMDRDAMNPLITGTDDGRLDRLVIRAVLARCEAISKDEIWLPYMIESRWGKELKRNHDIKAFQDGLLSVIDEVNEKTEAGSNAEILVEELILIVRSTQHSQENWMKTLIEHGDVILHHSDSWKIRYYHWWSQGENALFVYYKIYANDDEDVLISQEFEIRNKLIAMLVAQEWELAGAKSMVSNDREIFTGHHRELRRDGKKLVFFYRSIELDVVGQDGQKQRVPFMAGDVPLKIEEVMNELKKHCMPD